MGKAISKTQNKQKLKTKEQKQRQTKNKETKTETKILFSASHLLVTINCSSNFAIYCAKVISKTQNKQKLKTKEQKQTKTKNPCVRFPPPCHNQLLKQLCHLLCKGDFKNTKQTKTKNKRTKTNKNKKSLC